MRLTHEATGWLLIVSNALAGGWCLAAYRWPRLRSRALWYAVTFSQIVPFVQATLGAVWANNGGVLRDMHALYGFSTIVSVAILYSYRKSDFAAGDKRYLLYGFGCLFIMGLGLRNLAL